jgi:membrane protein DedA with SNARE-associated domain
MLDWITRTIAELGVWGIAFLMFAENIFPPIPSELIMPLAGFTAAQGKLPWLGVLLAGLLGTLLGVLPWYYAGRILGTERLKAWAGRWGKYACIRPADIDKADAWFDKHGRWVVLFGRLIPGVRTLISVPAGSCGMPLGPFLLYSAIGSLIWCGGLMAAGMALGRNYAVLEAYIGPVGKIALGVIVLGGIGWIAWRWRRERRGRRGEMV